MEVGMKINKSDYQKLQRKLANLKAFDRHGGSLRQSISFSGKGKQVVVVADKKYAPYVEFGTGGKVKLDDMLELGIPSSYAMQFKGKGIREVNLPARPFFFSSARIGFKNLYDRVNRRLNKIIK